MRTKEGQGALAPAGGIFVLGHFRPQPTLSRLQGHQHLGGL